MNVFLKGPSGLLPGQTGERPRWRRFLSIIFFWLKQKNDLGEDYIHAKVDIEKQKAKKALPGDKSTLSRKNNKKDNRSCLADKSSKWTLRLG